MALERTNPLRPGVFWLDVWRPPTLGTRPAAGPGSFDAEPIFRDWEAANTAQVRVLKRETHDGAVGQPLRIWYLFQVLAPNTTPFPSTKLGFPTIKKLGTPEEISPLDQTGTSDDTVQKPPSEPLFDVAPLLAGLTTGALIIGGAIFASSFLPRLLLRNKGK